MTTKKPANTYAVPSTPDWKSEKPKSSCTSLKTPGRMPRSTASMSATNESTTSGRRPYSPHFTAAFLHPGGTRPRQRARKKFKVGAGHGPGGAFGVHDQRRVAGSDRRVCVG